MIFVLCNKTCIRIDIGNNGKFANEIMEISISYFVCIIFPQWSSWRTTRIIANLKRLIDPYATRAIINCTTYTLDKRSNNSMRDALRFAICVCVLGHLGQNTKQRHQLEQIKSTPIKSKNKSVSLGKYLVMKVSHRWKVIFIISFH